MELAGKYGAVVVLGDIGRSPRMQYQALSLSKHGARISLIGYQGSQPFTDVLSDKKITICYLPEWVYRPKARIMFLASLPFRIIFECAVLLYTLIWSIKRPSFILVQNPPSIPSLLIAKIASVILGSDLIIDWHNFGFTILSLRLGRSHLFVRIAYLYERICGRMADRNICVTRAMQKVLNSNWNIQASVLHDRPPAKFRRLNLDKIHEFFINLQQSALLQEASDWLPPRSEWKKQTIITEKTDGIVRYRSGRPALIVTSTSYTPDENIGMLLDALLIYDRNHTASDPRLLVIITGKGPLMEFYSKEIKLLNLNHVKVIQAWLSADDYPKILGSADLGISLHISSSGLDLPMKVVDMFGSGLPVCAVGFGCLDELVIHRKNGLVFHSSSELKDQLSEIVKNDTLLNEFRQSLNQFMAVRWDDCWNQNALPCFTRDTKTMGIHIYFVSAILILLIIASIVSMYN